MCCFQKERRRLFTVTGVLCALGSFCLGIGLWNLLAGDASSNHPPFDTEPCGNMSLTCYSNNRKVCSQCTTYRSETFCFAVNSTSLRPESNFSLTMVCSHANIYDAFGMEFGFALRVCPYQHRNETVDTIELTDCLEYSHYPAHFSMCFVMFGTAILLAALAMFFSKLCCTRSCSTY